MSSSRSAPLIDLDIRPSRQLAAFVVLIHLLALVAVAAAGIPWLLRVALGVALAGNLVRACAQGHPGLGSIRRAVWFADGEWALVDVHGRSFGAEAEPGPVCLPWLVVVRLRPLRAGRVRNLVLAADSADADVLRRLRTRLRLEV